MQKSISKLNERRENSVEEGMEFEKIVSRDVQEMRRWSSVLVSRLSQSSLLLSELLNDAPSGTDISGSLIVLNALAQLDELKVLVRTPIIDDAGEQVDARIAINIPQ